MSAPADSDVTYRRMSEDDVETVAEIERLVHAHPWTTGNFRDSLEAGYECWVAEAHSQIVAYGVVTIGAGESHLLNLSVAARWQRRGLGSQMTDFLVKLARDYGAETMFLEVRPSNRPAQALYASKGFSEIGRRTEYYPATDGREDAVVMERRLT